MVAGAGDSEPFKKIAARLKDLPEPEKEPARFVIGVHRQWKAAGGKVAGKPRHSDQYLRDQLNAADTPVKSLTPKLVGKTNIGADDGASLLRFFFSNWPEAGAKEGEIRYAPLLSEQEIDTAANSIAAALAKRASGRPRAAVTVLDDASIEPLPGEPIRELIVRHFQECDALITVAPTQSVLTARPQTELIGFRGLMDNLWKIERRDHKSRALIWVLEAGGLNMDDIGTRKKYLGMQQLLIRFKALEHFHEGSSDDKISEQRLDWVRSRGIIILLDAHRDWREEVHVPEELPHFFPHHVTNTNIHPDWLASPNFRALYGSELERIDERVFNVFFNASCKWPSAPDNDSDLRYFGYSTFKTADGFAARGLELPLPESGAYSVAKRTVCAAAAHTLKLKIPPSKELQVSGETAVEQLNYLGFRVLRVDEFVEMY